MKNDDFSVQYLLDIKINDPNKPSDETSIEKFSYHFDMFRKVSRVDTKLQEAWAINFYVPFETIFANNPIIEPKVVSDKDPKIEMKLDTFLNMSSTSLNLNNLFKGKWNIKYQTFQNILVVTFSPIDLNRPNKVSYIMFYSISFGKNGLVKTMEMTPLDYRDFTQEDIDLVKINYIDYINGGMLMMYIRDMSSFGKTEKGERLILLEEILIEGMSFIRLNLSAINILRNENDK